MNFTRGTSRVIIFSLLFALISCDTPQGRETFGQILQMGGGIVASVTHDRVGRQIGGAAVLVGTAMVIEARHAQAVQLAEARRRAANYNSRSRYVAQRVSRDRNATGAATVVLYDTKTQQVVGDSVYDLDNVPKKGSQLAVGGRTAEFSP